MSFLNPRQEDWGCPITAVLRKRSGEKNGQTSTCQCYGGASDLRANLPALVDSGSLRSFLNFTFKINLWVLGFSCSSILLTPLLFSNPQSSIYSTNVLKLVFPGQKQCSTFHVLFGIFTPILFQLWYYILLLPLSLSQVYFSSSIIVHHDKKISVLHILHVSLHGTSQRLHRY